MAEAEKLQLVRKLDERVIERAEADPQWKRQFVEDPPTAVGDMPEVQRLREIDEESARHIEQQPPEATILTPTEEYKQLMESLTDKVLDRAASAPLWKELFLTDPQAAMREAGFLEYQRLEEIRQEAEVQGHYMDLMTLDPAGGAFDYYTTPRCRPYYKSTYSTG